MHKIMALVAIKILKSRQMGKVITTFFFTKRFLLPLMFLFVFVLFWDILASDIFISGLEDKNIRQKVRKWLKILEKF